MSIFFSTYSGIIDIWELLVSLFSFIGGTEDIDNAKAVLKFLLQWFDGLASDHDTLLIDQMGKLLAFKIPIYLLNCVNQDVKKPIYMVKRQNVVMYKIICIFFNYFHLNSF